MGKGDSKGGRPRKEIDLAELQRMCQIQCTAEECARILGVDADTINARLKESGWAGFSDFYKKHSDEGKRSLRRAQFRTAIGTPKTDTAPGVAGNPTMQIWLGKQHLGQKDITRLEQTGADGGPIQVEELNVRDRIARRLDGLKVVAGTDVDSEKPKRRRGADT